MLAQLRWSPAITNITFIETSNVIAGDRNAMSLYMLSALMSTIHVNERRLSLYLAMLVMSIYLAVTLNV